MFTSLIFIRKRSQKHGVAFKRSASYEKNTNINTCVILNEPQITTFGVLSFLSTKIMNGKHLSNLIIFINEIC